MDRRNIVVIGASAGGLDAVRALVRPLEAGSPAALFLVTHLTPGPSRLDEILAAETALEVRFARDEEAIRPGTLLIAPPDRHLILERSRISLRRGPRENLWRPSIDVLFRSAAVAFASRVIGIILSGALDDGASGLRAVARCGGLCVVQTPADAPYPEMPECALRAVPDARVMSATELAAALPALVAEAAPPSAPIPDQIQLEARVAAGDEGATREIEARGEPTSLTCPECGGPLKRQPGTFLRFRCRLGHAFSSSTLEEASREALESSLWAAIRLLEQRANIDLTRSSQERDRGRIGAAGVYQERASETTGHAEVLREMLSKLPARSGGEPVQHQRRTSLG